MEWLLSWECTSVVVVAALGTAIGVLAMNDFKLAKLCFLVAAADAIGGTVMAISRSGLTGWAQGVAVFIASGCIGALFLVSLKYVNNKKDKFVAEQTPNLVFVFGVPLGDNDSASWLMMLRHYGPAPAYNCDIRFYDNDRKNVEHEWLVAHPDSPFPPPGLAAGESQHSLHVPEVGSEGSTVSFIWKPLDPDRQHYSVSIGCRDGVFEETWEVTRVNGDLRSTITIEHGIQWVKKNSRLNPVVFKCEDPEFISTPIATAVPKSTTGKIAHPGWKPTHKFEMPVAIIDPNGNLQIGGITLPDGTLSHGSGCWNILTQHFGDNPATRQ